jgi:hypothetical protein
MHTQSATDTFLLIMSWNTYVLGIQQLLLCPHYIVSIIFYKLKRYVSKIGYVHVPGLKSIHLQLDEEILQQNIGNPIK